MRERIASLQRQRVTQNAIYDNMAQWNEALGHPLVHYEEFLTQQAEAKKTAKKAATKAARDANAARKVASTEFANKRKCVELEQTVRNKQIWLSSTTTETTTSASLFDNGISPGSYVSVTADLSRPGVCFHGGCGFVQSVDGESIVAI